MLKFKLIKEYPSCFLKVNSIIEFKDNCQQIINSDGNFIINDLLNYPEFWEKIEEEYEILKLINPNNGETLSDKENINSWLEGYAKTTWNINSVKRLNDNTIFTIGDNVYNPNCKSQTFVIESFYLDCNSKHMLCGSGHINITKIEHCRKPILITHDGVDIFEGDKYFSVDKQSFSLADNGKPQYHPFANNKSCWLTFSTIEKAEEYVNLNKPKYSEKDMLSFGVFAQGIYMIPENIYSILERWKFKNNK